MSIQELGSGNHASARYFVYRAEDPSEYGYICPGCYKRYGEKQGRGDIDVKRCDQCPTFQKWEMQRFYKPSPHERGTGEITL